MARSSTGKSVARAAATGGGRTYRARRPTTWLTTVIIVVVLGVLSVFWARYEYRNGSGSNATPPTVGTTWHAGFVFDICGTQLPSPKANVNASLVGIYTEGQGIMTIAPKKASEAGANATLGRFVSDYHGMTLTTQTIQSPGDKQYRNGEKCPSGTPDAGKKGNVQVRYWSGVGLSQKQGKNVSGDPRGLKLADGQLITMAFLPEGAAVPKPNGTIVAALLGATAGGSTSTSTTLPTVSTTTTPTSTTATTAPTSTTAATTTTSPATTTTTTKKK